MRTLVVTENTTLDGVIDMVRGLVRPARPEVDRSDIAAANAERSRAADALLVGRATFEAFRGFWPQPTERATVRVGAGRARAARGAAVRLGAVLLRYAPLRPQGQPRECGLRAPAGGAQS